MYKFGRISRSTFAYWFAHWCAFQMIALNLHIWKPKYLLHDVLKPWMKLFMPYEKVQFIHRKHSSHHLEYSGKHDWIAMALDWECSRYTKRACDRNAREEVQYLWLTSQIDQPTYQSLIDALNGVGL